MDRLTVKSEIVNGYILKCMCGFGRDGVPDDEDACRDICNGNCDECGIKQAFDKLAAYEDTGLTPEEIKTLQEDNARLQKLIDRDTAKRVDEEDCCPICNTYGKDDEGAQGEFCPNCGQRLDWGDDNA